MALKRQRPFPALGWAALIYTGSVLGQASTPNPDPDPASKATSPNLSALQKQGAVIGEIHIDTVNVFDTEDPADNKFLFRLANRLHIRTKPNVIRDQLLFKPGDALSVSKISETERLLRTNDYLVDAQITPVANDNGAVDLNVRTQDVWTLNPGVNLSRSGGKNSYSFFVEESNLLGYGKDIQLEYESDVDRSSSSIRYNDPHLFGTWNQLLVSHSDNSDGSLEQLRLNHPFYSLDSRWGGGVSALDWDRVDKRYDLGEVVDQYRHQQRGYQAFYGLSEGLKDDAVKRWTFGVSYADDRYSPDPNFVSSMGPPDSHKWLVPFLGFEYLQDRFEQRRNETQIGRTEDIYSGKYLQAVLGFSSSSLVSDSNALWLGFSAGNSFESLDQQKALAVKLEGGGRIEKRRLIDASLTLDTEAYWRLTPHQLLFGSISGTVTHDLDSSRQLLLGGDFAGLTTDPMRNPSSMTPPIRHSEESLRGYPLRYQDGSAMGLLTLEHRIYTDVYLLRLFRLGGAVFFDAGRTWGRGTAGGESLGWLKDVGLGLRLGSTRSAFGNVIHIDVAFPLDGDRSIDRVQFVVQTKRSF